MEGTNVCKVWHFECSKSMTFAPRVHPLQSSSINSMLGFTAVAMTGKRMGLPSGVQICESENERKDSTSNTCILHHFTFYMMGIKSEPRSLSIYANITTPLRLLGCWGWWQTPVASASRVFHPSWHSGTPSIASVFELPKAIFFWKMTYPNAHSTKLLQPDTPLPSLSPPAYPTARAHRFLLDPLAKHGHALARSPRHQGRCPRDTLPRSFHHWRWVLSDLLAVQQPRHQGPACSGKFLCNQLPSSYHVSTSFYSKARLLVKNGKSWFPKSSRTIPTSATSSRRSSCLPLALAPHNEGCDRSHLQPPKGHICQRWAQAGECHGDGNSPWKNTKHLAYLLETS